MTSILKALGIVLCVGVCTTSGYSLNATLPILKTLPQIDGKVQDVEVEHATVLTSMTVLGGYDVPKHATQVMMFIARDSLYVAFRCSDSDPAGMVTKARENGAVFADDSVELLICPAPEATKKSYFHFAVNAAGTKYSNDMSNDLPVSNWRAAATRTATGWEAEMMIPLMSIKARENITNWRGNVVRTRTQRGSQREEQSVWVNPGVTQHNFQRFGFFKIQNDPFPELREAYGLSTAGSGNSSMRTSTSPTSAPGEGAASSRTFDTPTTLPAAGTSSASN